jgi:phage gp37-like protein
MNTIIAVEDFMIDKARELLGPNVGTTEGLPSAINLSILKTLISSNKTPGIYPVFLGGKESTGSRINARFDVYVIVRNVGSHTARRRGDSTERGAYLFLAALLKRLHDKTVPGVGTLKQKGIKNLFAMAVEENFNAALYVISFELPNMAVIDDGDIDNTALNDFIRFHSEHSLVDGDAEPAAIDDLTLPQD